MHRTELLERVEQAVHEVEDRAEAEVEGNSEKLRDPGHQEEGEEADEKPDDGVTNGVDGLLDLLLVAGGKDEGDAADDDVDETEDGCQDQAEGDDRCDDLDDGTVLDEISDHGEGKKETRRPAPVLQLSSLLACLRFRQ